MSGELQNMQQEWWLLEVQKRIQTETMGLQEYGKLLEYDFTKFV